jgi:uncharacterized protein (TIGR02145 family)
MKSLYLSLLMFFVSTSFIYSQNEVKIGKQIWMSENLNVDRFRNGDLIPEAKSSEAWERANDNKKPAWCYYDFNAENGKKYGKLYNSYAVNDSRGLAPKGFHVPSDAEWTTLVNVLGGENVAGKKIKSKDGWESGNGDNSSGFNGLPGGFCTYNGDFSSLGSYGLWWSSTASGYGGGDGIKRVVSSYSSRVNLDNGQSDGVSVRCLRD